jgi:hypothetical protein
MSKTASIHIWCGLLVSMNIVMLAGCRGMALTIPFTPQSLTALLPHTHYTPPEGSNIHVEFDYPGSWVFSEEKIQNTDIIFVGLGDPRLLTVSTQAANEPPWHTQ